jgi:branched-chain amino acid transport system ATP-binding protein
MSALRVEGVTVRFGGVEALSDVSLAVEAGEVCGVIGPNGAGKTTLFDAVSGLCRLSAGRISLAGADVTRLSAVRRARLGLRRTFQRQQVFGRLSVLDNLLAATEWRGGGGGLAADLFGLPSRRRIERRRRQRALAVLDACGLADRADAYAANLPAGLARLVEVGRAIVDEPQVLLLDEPTSGLDAAESARLAGVVARLAEAGDTAILLVEHDVTFVAETCGRLVVLDLGRVLADGPVAVVRSDPRVRAAYLGEEVAR